MRYRTFSNGIGTGRAKVQQILAYVMRSRHAIRWTAFTLCLLTFCVQLRLKILQNILPRGRADALRSTVMRSTSEFKRSKPFGALGEVFILYAYFLLLYGIVNATKSRYL